jgi:hypothetical protein
MSLGGAVPQSRRLPSWCQWEALQLVGFTVGCHCPSSWLGDSCRVIYFVPQLLICTVDLLRAGSHLGNLYAHTGPHLGNLYARTGPHLGNLYARTGPHLGNLYARTGPHLGNLYARTGPHVQLLRFYLMLYSINTGMGIYISFHESCSLSQIHITKTSWGSEQRAVKRQMKGL